MKLKHVLAPVLFAELLLHVNAAENILAGKSAIFEQLPAYNLTADENDAKDLTDGHINNWLVHFYKSSVGWYGHFFCSFYFDLGREMEIGEIKLHTSTGHGSVHLPEALFVMAGNSPDEFAMLDDMIASNPDLPKYEDGPKIFWITAKNRPVKARYLKFIALPHKDSTFFFADEITVAPGKNAVPVKRLPIFKGSTKQFIKFAKLQTRLELDLKQLAGNISLSGSRRSLEPLKTKLMVNAASVTAHHGNSSDFPINQAQIDLAQFQQKLLADAGYHGLVIWGGNRWDAFNSYTFPEKKSADAGLKMSPGETRSFIINTANASDDNINADFSIESKLKIEVNRCISSVEQNNFFNANKLLPIQPEQGIYRFKLIPGESSQLFFRLQLPRDTVAGIYPVKINFADGKTVTVKVTATALRFPERLSAEYGTWDYLNNPECHGQVIDSSNFDMAMKLIRAYQMNLCWGHEIALPPVTPDMFDADGRLIKPLNFTNLDEWLNTMKGFQYYAVFGGGHLDKRLNFGFKPTVNPEKFTKRLTTYLNALAAHIEQKHKLPADKFRIHFIDEASTPEQKQLLRLWSNGVRGAISPSGKRFYSYGNPFFGKKEEIYAYPELDIIQPNPGTYRRNDIEPFIKADQLRGAKGITGLYVCANRVRQRDAYMYFGMIYRLGILFNNFCGAGFWNLATAPRDICELDYTGRIFSTWYFEGNQIFVSRQAEALLEGREDYEYMLLLKTLVAELKKKHSPYAEEASKLLDSIRKNVLAELGGEQDNLSLWSVKKNRSAADSQRGQIIDFAVKIMQKEPDIFNRTIWK